mgnify:CR=1 FL=1
MEKIKNLILIPTINNNISPVVLSPFDFFKGISNLIVVVIQVIIGLKLVLKYPKFKDKTFRFYTWGYHGCWW